MWSEKQTIAQKVMKSGGPSFGTYFYEDRVFPKSIECLVAKSGFSDTAILDLAIFQKWQFFQPLK